jgi:hypothetical protein
MGSLLIQIGAMLVAAEAAGSLPPAERKAILDALRPVVEEEVGSTVEFVVDKLQVERGWAFVQAEPQRPDGTPIDEAHYYPETWTDMDGLTTTAILKRQGKRWRVVEWRMGATDAWYCGPLPNVDFDPCRR